MRFRAGLVSSCAIALLVMTTNNLTASETQSAQETGSSSAEPAQPSLDPLVPEITDLAEPELESNAKDDIAAR